MITQNMNVTKLYFNWLFLPKKSTKKVNVGPNCNQVLNTVQITHKNLILKITSIFKFI